MIGPSHLSSVATLRRSLIIAAVLFGVGFTPASTGQFALAPALAQAQDPLPATLHMRLGEAADGYRTGNAVFIVVGNDFPHDVEGIFPNREAAMMSLATVGADYSIQEVSTSVDFGREQLFALIGHRPESSCQGILAARTDCMALNGPWTIPFESIDSIRVEVFHEGDPITWTFGTNEVDALFFTYSAFEKFYAPYLTSVYGAEFAEQVRARFEEYLQSVEIR